MNKLAEIGLFVDSCLDVDLLNRIMPSEYKTNPPTTYSGKQSRHTRLFHALLKAVGSKVQSNFHRNLNFEESQIVDRRVRIFLTARGFDPDDKVPEKFFD